MRGDCTKRLDELEAIQPSVIFEAKDGSGHDLGAVTVTMDGHPFVDKLDGTALDVDPGGHEFTFTTPDQPSVTEKLIIKEGEKRRRERVIIGPLPPPPPQPVPVQPASGGLGTQSVLGIVAGGVGVTGVVVGSVFGLLTASAISAQKSDCPGNGSCPSFAQAASEHSSGSTDGTISTVAFIAGGALIAGGAVLFFTGRRQGEPAAKTTLTVVPSVGATGGAVLLHGEF